MILPGTESIAPRINGARRWLDLGITVQPSELAKISVVLWTAAIAVKKQDRLHSFRYGLLPFLLVLGSICLLVLLEPHFSAALMIAAVGAAILFAAGARFGHFALLGAAALPVLWMQVMGSGYRMARVTAFMNPDSTAAAGGYQLKQSLMAVGSGGMFGVGFGRSSLKMSYLPEPQNDFIYSIIAEEWGFIGAAAVILLFLAWALLGLQVSRAAPDLYGRLVAVGITASRGVRRLRPHRGRARADAHHRHQPPVHIGRRDEPDSHVGHDRNPAQRLERREEPESWHTASSFPGGGTGGHLMPALNLAAALRRAEPTVELLLVGARRGIEASVLPDSGWPYSLLPLEPLYRSRPWRNWRLVSSAPGVLGGLSRAYADLRPQVVVGTGGYASGPAVAWGVAKGVATAIQEQNAMPGLVTRALAPHVDQIHLGYPEARGRIRPGRDTQVFESGNPVAAGPVAQPFDWPAGRVVLAFGGSQGALALNELLLDGLAEVADWPADVTVVWVAGPAHHEALAVRVRATGFSTRLRVVPFIPELGGQLDPCHPGRLSIGRDDLRGTLGGGGTGGSRSASHVGRRSPAVQRERHGVGGCRPHAGGGLRDRP